MLDGFPYAFETIFCTFTCEFRNDIGTPIFTSKLGDIIPLSSLSLPCGLKFLKKGIPFTFAYINATFTLFNFSMSPRNFLNESFFFLMWASNSFDGLVWNLLDLLHWKDIFISRFDVTVESISSLIYIKAIKNLDMITFVSKKVLKKRKNRKQNLIYDSTATLYLQPPKIKLPANVPWTKSRTWVPWNFFEPLLHLFPILPFSPFGSFIFLF